MWMVSNWTRAPAKVASGLSVKSCGRFQGLRFLSKWHLSSVLWTLDKETFTPSRKSSWWTTCPQRRRFILFSMMAETISLGKAWGFDLGVDFLVGISCQPVPRGWRHQREMVLGSTPYLKATFLMLQWRYLTKLTASRRTLDKWGFVVYAISFILAYEVLQRYWNITLDWQSEVTAH